MTKKRWFIDYFIKYLPPDEQRGIAGMVRDSKSSFLKERVQDEQNGYQNLIKQGWFKDVSQALHYVQLNVDKMNAIDERMKKNRLAPFFENITSAKEKYDYLELLDTFDDESRWNTLLGCKSFYEFEPPVFGKKISDLVGDAVVYDDTPVDLSFDTTFADSANDVKNAIKLAYYYHYGIGVDAGRKRADNILKKAMVGGKRLYQSERTNENFALFAKALFVCHDYRMQNGDVDGAKTPMLIAYAESLVANKHHDFESAKATQVDALEKLGDIAYINGEYYEAKDYHDKQYHKLREYFYDKYDYFTRMGVRELKAEKDWQGMRSLDK